MLKIGKNSFYILLGNISYALAQWGVITFIAKLGETKEIGNYSYSISLVGPLIMFANLHLRAIITVENKSTFEFIRYYILRVVMIFVVSAFMLVFIFFSTYDEHIKKIVVIVLFIKSVESISDIIYGYNQRFECFRVNSQSQVIKSVLIMVSFSVVFFLSKSIEFALLAVFFCTLLVFLFFDIRNLPPDLIEQIRFFKIPLFLSEKKNKIGLKKIFLDALPMGIAAMFYALLTAIPRYFLKSSVGSFELGIFTGIIYLSSSLQIIANAIADATLPKFGVLFSQKLKDEFIGFLMKCLIGVTIVCGLIFLIVKYDGEIIIKYLFNKDFENYNYVLLIGIIIVWTEIINKFLGNCLTVMNVYSFQTFFYLIQIVFLTLSCFYLIPTYSIRGVLYAIISMNVAQMIIYYTIIHVRGKTVIL